MSLGEILIYLGIIIFLMPDIFSKIKEIIAGWDINPETDDPSADTLCLGGICQNKCNNMNGQEVKRTANMGLLGEDSNIFQAGDCGADKVLKDLDIVDILCGDGTAACEDSDCCRPKQCETDTEDTVAHKATYFREAGLYSEDISGVQTDADLLDLYATNSALRVIWSAKQRRDGNCPYQQTVKLNTNCTGTHSGIGMDCSQDFCCVPKTCSTDWSGTNDWSSTGGAKCPTGTGRQHPSGTSCDTCGQDECCYNESDFCSASTPSPPNDNDIVTPANSYRGLDTNMENVQIDSSTLNLTYDGLAYLQKNNLIDSSDAVANRAALDAAIACSTGYKYGICDGTGTDGTVCNSHDNNERECRAAGCDFQLGDHPRVIYEGCTLDGSDGSNSSIYVGDCKNTCTGNIDLTDTGDGYIYFFEDHGNPTLQGNRVNSAYDRGLESKKSIDIDWPSDTESRICDSMGASGEYLEYDYSCMGGGSYFTVSNLANCNQTCGELYANGAGWGCGEDKIYDFDPGNDGTPATHDSFIEQCCVAKTCQNSSGGESVYCYPYQKLKTTDLPTGDINSGACCEPKTCGDVINDNDDLSSDYGKAWSADTSSDKSPRKHTADFCINGTFKPENEVNNRYLAGRDNLGLSTDIDLSDFVAYFGSDRTDIGCCVTQTCANWATQHLTEGDDDLQVRANAYCGTGFSFNNEMVASSAFDGSQPSTGNPCCVSEAEIICSPTADMGTGITGIIGYDITFDDQSFGDMSFNNDVVDGVYRPVNTEGPTINGCAVSDGWTPTAEGPHLRCIPSTDGLHKLYSITGCLPPDPDSCTSTLVAEPHSVTQYDTVNCNKTGSQDAGVTPGSCAAVDLDVAACEYVAGEQSQCTTSAAALSEGAIKICQVPDQGTHPGVIMTDFTSGVSQSGLVNMTNFAHQLDIITCQNSSNKPCFTTCDEDYGEFTISGCDYQDKLGDINAYFDDNYWAQQPSSDPTSSPTSSPTSCSDLRNTLIAKEPSVDIYNTKGNAKYFTCKCPTGSSCPDTKRQTRFKYIWDEDEDNFDANGAKQSNRKRNGGVPFLPSDVLTAEHAEGRAICNPGYFPFRDVHHDYCKPCTEISDKSPSEWIPHSLCDNTLPPSGLLSVPTSRVGDHNLYEADGGHYNYDYRYLDGATTATTDSDNYTGPQSDRVTGELSFATRKLENQEPQTRIRGFGDVPDFDFSVDYPGTQGNSLSIIKSYWNEYFKEYLVGGDTPLTVVGASGTSGTSGTSGPIDDISEITAENLATRDQIFDSEGQPVEICKDKYTTPVFDGTVGTCVQCQNGSEAVSGTDRKTIPHLRDNAQPICSLEARFHAIDSNHLNIISADNEDGTSCDTDGVNCCEEGFQWYNGTTYRNKCIPNPATLVNECSGIADEVECPKHMQSIATEVGPEMTLCEWSGSVCGVTNHHTGTRINVPGPGEKMYIDDATKTTNEITFIDEREFLHIDTCPLPGSDATGIEWYWAAKNWGWSPCALGAIANFDGISSNLPQESTSRMMSESLTDRVARTTKYAGMGVPARLNAPGTYLNKDDHGIKFVTDKYNHRDHDSSDNVASVWATKIDEIAYNVDPVESCVSECLGTDECDLIKLYGDQCTLYNLRFTADGTGPVVAQTTDQTTDQTTGHQLVMPPQAGEAVYTAHPVGATGKTSPHIVVGGAGFRMPNQYGRIMQPGTENSGPVALEATSPLTTDFEAWIIETDADEADSKAADNVNGQTGRDWNIGGVYILQGPDDFDAESLANKDDFNMVRQTQIDLWTYAGRQGKQLIRLTDGSMLASIGEQSSSTALAKGRLYARPDLSTFFGTASRTDRRPYWKKIGAGTNPDLFLFYGNHNRWLISTKLTLWLGNTTIYQGTRYYDVTNGFGGHFDANPDSLRTIDKEGGFIVAYSDGTGHNPPPGNGWHTLFNPVPGNDPTTPTVNGDSDLSFDFDKVMFTNALSDKPRGWNWDIPGAPPQGRNRELMNTIWTGSQNGGHGVQAAANTTGITFSDADTEHPAETWVSMNKITGGGGGVLPPPTPPLGHPYYIGNPGESCTEVCLRRSQDPMCGEYRCPTSLMCEENPADLHGNIFDGTDGTDGTVYNMSVSEDSKDTCTLVQNDRDASGGNMAPYIYNGTDRNGDDMTLCNYNSETDPQLISRCDAKDSDAQRICKCVFNSGR